MRSLVLEARSRHEQFLPHGGWGAAICEHALNHDAQSPPHAFGHTDLLRCVGGGGLMDSTGLQAVLPKRLPGVIAALVDVPVATFDHWRE